MKYMNPQTLYITEYESPCGGLLLGELDGMICLCDWIINGRGRKTLKKFGRSGVKVVEPGDTELTDKVAQELDEYFAGKRVAFDIPLRLIGTEFQKRVWEKLLSVPFGETLSYRVIAESVGKPTAVRAVANAIGANPLSILIPCHRIIGSDGSVTGYAGGLIAKRYLLNLEKV